METFTPQQLDALGRMNKEIHTEYRSLRLSGLGLDPSHFLSFREQTRNNQFIKMVVSDNGVFFLDTVRKIKFKFHPYLFIYQDGLSPQDQEKLEGDESPLIRLENGLEFWKRHGTGTCLIQDLTNSCDYLLPEYRTEIDRVRNLYRGDELVINPMLHKKSAEASSNSVQVLSLED
jgi:hypothetical protein